VFVAIALRGWRLGDTGFLTPYYLAGVRSMTAGWHNLFFNSFDPAGFLSLDKPPVAFWLQAASVRVLGFSSFAALLPQAIEGIVTIVLLYALVRRYFGTGAGLLAAALLAITPVAVAVDRSNNTESCLVLVLLLAALALLRAVETGRLRYLLLAAALVGIGFNVKMLVAFGVVPVFSLLYLIAAPVVWRRRIGHLAAAGAVLFAVALSWSLAYDLTPAPNRPFAGSSRDNSMLELAVDHNLIRRFVRPNYRSAPPPATAAPGQRGRDFAPAGVLRLAAPRLAAQMNWLLPLVLIGGVAAWFRTRGSTAAGAQRQMLMLWAGWALAYGVVFSAADGLFQAYYLAVIAPALCALAAIGTLALFSYFRAGGTAALLLPGALFATALWQWHIVDGYRPDLTAFAGDWIAPGLFALSVAMAGAVALFRHRQKAPMIAAAGTAAILVLPAAWAIGTAAADGNVGFPSARPPFLTETATAQRARSSLIVGAAVIDPKLLAFLQRQRHGVAYLLATVNARQAAPIIIATGAPVMAFGGYSGSDPILQVADFARFVAQGQLRFVMIGDGSPGLRRIFGERRQQKLIDWIRANGQPVDLSLW
jgi:4-amino-4-deoxy-L-arabinose transferase-like glycosyltransferase